jgi:hypothetical protein
MEGLREIPGAAVLRLGTAMITDALRLQGVSYGGGCKVLLLHVLVMDQI